MKGWNSYTIVLILVVGLNLSCHKRDIVDNKETLLRFDYRLFQSTPLWNLAKAVEDGEVDEIKRIIKSERIDVNLQEDIYGETLLMLSILNNNAVSCEALLDVGADPNIHDTFSGSSAMILAAGIQDPNVDNCKFLKLLLARGGNPNDEEVGPRRSGNTTRNTPLLVACKDVIPSASTLAKVKLLVEAGANINYVNEYHVSPLKYAVVFDHYDVILYLLNRGVNYRIVLSNSEGKNMFLSDEMRYNLLLLNSKEYLQKMEVVDFLWKNGIDYRALPIPEFAVKSAKKMYPNSWKDYLNKY